MKLLLTGGSANGKSTYGRQLARCFPEPRYLIRTELPYPEESQLEQNRANALSSEGFVPVSCSSSLETLQLPQRGTVLLDCLCHLTANEMFDTAGYHPHAAERVLHGLAALEAQCDTLIVVTNEIGCDVRRFSDATPLYMQTLSTINTTLARQFDCVCEVVCGIPCAVKGFLPLLFQPAATPTSHLTLVVGSAASGKRDYTQCLGYLPSEMSHSPEDNKPVLLDLQTLAADLPEITPALLDTLCRKHVILCDEVGSGVIPLDSRERNARVQTGTLCVLLAQRAKTVVRLVCGIPIILKETHPEKNTCIPTGNMLL